MRLIELIWALLLLFGAVSSLSASRNDFKSDPEETMTAPEIIRYWKYPCEIHHVTTKDGYVLELHRIPFGLNDTKPKNGPILLMHGLLGDSTDYVMNIGHENLAFLLADLGYDVWIGNVRGTRYSRNHTSLNPDKDIAFWKFSWDEMGLIDVPAKIDYILSETNVTKLPYVGISMGTTMMFSLLSLMPEYNDKVSGFFALAPVAHMEHTRSPIKFLAPFINVEEVLIDLLGHGELEINQNLLEFFGNTLCTIAPKLICENLEFLIVGYDPDQMNATRLPVYIAHYPGDTSTQTVVHYAQIINSKKFQMFDYGADENIVKYYQLTPPEYNLTKITAPVYLFWGENDVFADKEDVAKASTELKSLKSNYRVPFDMFGHIDFQLAIDVDKLVYNELVELLSTIPK